ncbi:unnamed protein product [Symbiodinium microadriaticum]|nr:unnamed protein product [Symbiodinium microadriaticum]
MLRSIALHTWRPRFAEVCTSAENCGEDRESSAVLGNGAFGQVTLHKEGEQAWAFKKMSHAVLRHRQLESALEVERKALQTTQECPSVLSLCIITAMYEAGHETILVSEVCQDLVCEYMAPDIISKSFRGLVGPCLRLLWAPNRQDDFQRQAGRSVSVPSCRALWNMSRWPLSTRVTHPDAADLIRKLCATAEQERTPKIEAFKTHPFFALSSLHWQDQGKVRPEISNQKYRELQSSVALQPSEAQVLVVIVSLSLGFGVGAKICGSNSKPYHSMVARGGGGCRCANIHESITLRPPFSGLGLPLEILGNTRIRSTRIVDARLQPGPWFLPLNFHGSGQPYVRAKHPWRVYRVLFAYTVAQEDLRERVEKREEASENRILPSKLSEEGLATFR